MQLLVTSSGMFLFDLITYALFYGLIHTLKRGRPTDKQEHPLKTFLVQNKVCGPNSLCEIFEAQRFLSNGT